ncbi:MAG TPA: serine/threonine-protein kinase [Phycisphaerales bacterium]|nr:serine/threonine-protein kinase [Phycisphaerales bacterium]
MSNADRQNIRRIFMEVVELRPQERGAALDRLCGPSGMDPKSPEGQRRAEVQRLLDADESASGFMSSPTGSEVPTTISGLPISERPGAKIGVYKLLEVIGEGGFGTVFMAEQSEPVRRRVALKIIKLGMDTRSIVARFEQERQALAIMDHPNIARVFDAGSTETGRPYFVMEYVRGQAITAFADEQKLSMQDRLNIFIQVCNAVQHAHTKGVIHRDIKPSNILVCMTDGKPLAKVIDFGIAKATGGGGALTDKTLFTEHRQLIGTPEYMSPEQAQGSPDIDTRTDVYGLGVLLYELLTGLTPFDSARLRSAAFDEMRRIIKEEDPPAPSVRVTQRMMTPARGGAPGAGSSGAGRMMEIAGGPSTAAQLRGELDWIILKCLDKDRARRYETPRQLAEDVKRHMSGEAITAAPAGLGYRVRKFVRKHRGPVIAAGAVTAALLAGIAGTASQWKEAEDQARIASASAMSARLAQAEADKARGGAEWSAYTANLALAQMAMDAGNWPEARERIEQAPAANRGWEWRFLRDRSRRVVHAFQGLAGSDHRAIVTRDGRYLLVPTGKDRAQEWDLSKDPPALVGERAVDLYHASAVSFSPDHARMLVCGGGAVEIFGPDEGERTGATLGTTNGYGFSFDAQFSPDGRWIATSTNNDGERVILWDATRRPPVAVSRHEGGEHWIESVHFLPDSSGLITCGGDGRAVAWSIEGGTLASAREIVPADGYVVCAAVDRSTSSVILGSLHGSAPMERFSLSSVSPGRGAWMHMAPGAQAEYGGVGIVSVSPSGDRVFTASWQGAARFWDARGRLMDEFKLPVDPSSPWLSPGPQNTQYDSNMMTSAFSPDGAVAALTFDHYAWLLDARAPAGGEYRLSAGPAQRLYLEAAFEGRLARTPEPVRRVTTPDGQRTITAGFDRTIRFEEPGTERVVTAIRVEQQIKSIGMAGEGLALTITLEDDSVLVWDIREPEARRAVFDRMAQELEPAQELVDRLLAGDVSGEGLRRAILEDESLSPARRVVGLGVLENRLGEMRREVDRVLAGLTGDQPAGDVLRARAEALELSPRLKAMAIAAAGEWRPPATRESLAAELDDANRQKELLEADKIMLRQTQPDEDLGTGTYKFPTRDELQRAYAQRRKHLGLSDPRTLEAWWHATRWVEGADDSVLFAELDAMVEGMQGLKTPLGPTHIDTLLYITERYQWRLAYERAEKVNAMIAGAIVPAFERGEITRPPLVRSLPVPWPHVPEDFDLARAKELAGIYAADAGETLRARLRKEIPESLFVAARSHVGEWDLDRATRAMGVDAAGGLMHTAVALMNYRLQRYDDAMTSLEVAKRGIGEGDRVLALTREAILAMVQFQRGEVLEARGTLARVESMLKALMEAQPGSLAENSPEMETIREARAVVGKP